MPKKEEEKKERKLSYFVGRSKRRKVLKVNEKKGSERANIQTYKNQRHENMKLQKKLYSWGKSKRRKLLKVNETTGSESKKKKRPQNERPQNKKSQKLYILVAGARGENC